MFMIRMIIIRVVIPMIVVHRLCMRRDRGSIFHVVNGMVTPITMHPLPILEMMQPVTIHYYPGIVGTQIIILAAHQPHIFSAIIVVIIRDHHRRRWRCHHHWRRRCGS